MAVTRVTIGGWRQETDDALTRVTVSGWRQEVTGTAGAATPLTAAPADSNAAAWADTQAGLFSYRPALADDVDA